MSRKPRFTNLPTVLNWNGELLTFEDGWQLYPDDRVRYRSLMVMHKRALCIGKDEEGNERRFVGKVIGKARNDWMSRMAFLVEHEWTGRIEFAQKIFPVGEKELPHEDLCCRVDDHGRSVRPVLLQPAPSGHPADCPGSGVCTHAPAPGEAEAGGGKKASTKVHLQRRVAAMQI